MKIADKILDRVRRAKPGMKVFGPRDFLDLGARTAIDKALSRLAGSGVLRRVGRGLYDMPRHSALIGRAAPASLDAVVDAVSRRFDVQIVPDHGAAANALGLTTAVPVRPSFLSSRAIGDIKLDGRKISVRPAGKVLAPWLGTAAAPLVQSLIWLRDGDFAFNADVIAKLKKAASPQAKASLAKDIGRLPGWALPVAHAIVANDAAR
jgi:hypothetical protein